uniref:Uncharacterized protein n=1 Tax=Anguilla anguilla TaxID=7936 RepID=A0A0E9U712_ANGAN
MITTYSKANQQFLWIICCLVCHCKNPTSRKNAYFAFMVHLFFFFFTF